jgi:hypothetical protein
VSDQDQYVESLAADVYWAAEQWFRRVDPYHAHRPFWGSLRDDYKAPYRDAARSMIADKAAKEAAQ